MQVKEKVRENERRPGMGKMKKEISLKYILLFLLKVSLKEKIIIITTFFTTTEVVGYDWCTIKIMLIIVQIK